MSSSVSTTSSAAAASSPGELIIVLASSAIPWFVMPQASAGGAFRLACYPDEQRLFGEVARAIEVCAPRDRVRPWMPRPIERWRAAWSHDSSI